MYLLGSKSGRLYCLGPLLARAGEGAVYLLARDANHLVKIFDRPPSAEVVAKLDLLANWPHKSPLVAFPTETVVAPGSRTVVGYVQPHFRRTVPLTRVLDSAGRRALNLPGDLAFQVKLCCLLAEALACLHAANLVMGDVSDSNFLIGWDWLGRVTGLFVIDCNSVQVSVRTHRGTETHPSGVATEAYAAPEVQPTDWATSLRTVFSDSFGLAVLAWQLIFNRSHPFAVATPRNVDVSPLGKRIEHRLFPFSPAVPLQSGWRPPALTPSLAVLPPDVRELFFRTFSTADPRDRPSAEAWAQAFRAWERELAPTLVFRLFGLWDHSLSEQVAAFVGAIKPWAGRGVVFLGIVLLVIFSPRLETTRSSPESAPAPQPASQPPRAGELPVRHTRPRTVDRDLFPEPLWESTPLERK